MIFFAATVALLFVGRGLIPMASAAAKVQIVPSALAATIGATGFWLVATIVFGRIYCSTVCPMGAIQDSANWLRRQIRAVLRARGVLVRSPFTGRLMLRSYSFRPRWRGRKVILFIYLALLLAGASSLACLLEPWRILKAAAADVNPALSGHPGMMIVGDTTFGVVYGIVVTFGIWLSALLHGRRFCTNVCPIGTVLECVAERSVYRIEIDPDRCVNCMRCEAICKAEAIDVSARLVDNGRCVRCFDCLKVCNDDAIRLQRGNNRRANPLLTPNS